MKLGTKLLMAPLLTAAVALTAGEVNAWLMSREARLSRESVLEQNEHFKTLAGTQTQLGQLHASVYRTVALMASLGSKFNASATLFTMDFFREWYPNASGKTEVRVGRIATAVIVAIGICWVLVIKSMSSNLYTYLQSVQSYLSPAIVVLFVLGVFWKRANATGALVSFVIGVVLGFARLAADIYMRGYDSLVLKLKRQLFEGQITQAVYDAAIAPIKAENGLIFTLWNINWLYYCQILFVLTAVIMVAVSLLTKAPDIKTVRFTWYGATDAEKAATRASWGMMDVVLSLVAVAFVIAFYIAFW